jgi:hypothetical protein
MVSVIVSSAVDRGSSLGQVKPKTMQLIFVASPLSTQYWGEREKTGGLGIRIMCPSGATCLPRDCYFSPDPPLVFNITHDIYIFTYWFICPKFLSFITSQHIQTRTIIIYSVHLIEQLGWCYVVTETTKYRPITEQNRNDGFQIKWIHHNSRLMSIGTWLDDIHQ